MRVLLSAYSCEPGRGSEPGVGWNVVHEVSKYHEVWVLTRPDESRSAIEAVLAHTPNPNLHFVYFTLPIWSDSHRFGQMGGMQLHYYLWQIKAYFVARRLHRQINFDLVHHVTFGNYWGACYLSLLPIPFIWGPVGGGEIAPKPFWQDFSFHAKVYESLRDVTRWVGERDPFLHLTAQRSSVALVTNSETLTRVKLLGAKNIEKFASQTGINDTELAQLENVASLTSTSPIRFVSIGRLLHWKGFHLGLRAFAQAGLEQGEYWVLGDGPERQRLEQLAQDLKIHNRVFFLGLKSRSETLDIFGKCHVLVHPSLHDFSPTVCLEALAAGRPVLCLDLGGPGVQITPETGIKVPALYPEQTVNDLAAAMHRIAENPDLYSEMSKAAKKRARQLYTWDLKGKELVALYERVLSGNSKASEASTTSCPGD